MSCSPYERRLLTEGVPAPLELSFEYLMSKNEMRWIKVISSQAVLMSLCLQGMVKQLLNSQNGSFPSTTSVSIVWFILSYQF